MNSISVYYLIPNYIKLNCIITIVIELLETLQQLEIIKEVNMISV